MCVNRFFFNLDLGEIQTKKFVQQTYQIEKNSVSNKFIGCLV